MEALVPETFNLLEATMGNLARNPEIGAASFQWFVSASWPIESIPALLSALHEPLKQYDLPKSAYKGLLLRLEDCASAQIPALIYQLLLWNQIPYEDRIDTIVALVDANEQSLNVSECLHYFALAVEAERSRALALQKYLDRHFKITTMPSFFTLLLLLNAPRFGIFAVILLTPL